MARRRATMRKPRNKFRAIPTRGYASRLEANTADMLRAQLIPGETLIEQIPIKFACGARYICDFGVVNDATGEIVRWVESKGFETPVWRLKLRMLHHEHPGIADKLTIIGPPARKRKTRKKAAV